MPTTTETLQSRGYSAAMNDYPEFKTENEVRKDHGPAWVRGYMKAIWDTEEHQAEYEAERAAERYYEEGPHGNLYDDPRGE